MVQLVDVTQVVDRQRVTPFLLGILALCLLVTMADGYNITVTSFAAPVIVKAWHLDRAALGPLFSSSLIAGLVGPFLFGALGDRIGRRNAIIVSVVTIGVFGLISGLCTSLTALVATRFVAGIGMSGALAVTVAAVNEFAPRRLRATFVTIVFSGTTIGSGLPGLIAAPIAQSSGWPMLFFIGGAVPLVLAAVVYWLLPESPKFLCLRPERDAELAALVRRLAPDQPLPADARFTLGEEPASGRSGIAQSIGQLFVGKLALLTPLLWLGSFLAQTVFHSFNTWLPTLLTDGGMPFRDASLTVALFQFVGTLGGWTIARPVDKFGMIPCTLLYVLSVPIVVCLGMPANSAMLMVLVPAAGFCILGLHFAQVSCVSSVYPTAVRGLGVGWFMLFARVGGAIGPAVVGILVGRHVALRSLFYYATIPLTVGIFSSLAVAVIYNANFHRKGVAAPAPGGVQPALKT